MSRLIFLVVMLCGLASVAWAAPASGTSPSRAHPAVVRKADWLRKPSAEDVARYYPKAAVKQGLEGRATVTCHVLVSGDLAGCFLRQEQPKDAGFGAAALQMARLFKMRPKTIDGRAVDGGTVTIPIHFAIDPSQKGVIRNPDWLKRPSADDVARFYPEQAQRLGLEGRAKVTCRVLVSGDLADCVLREEEPKGAGFGQAALQMAKLFKMRPKTLDGRPVEGGTVTIPMRFNLDREAGQAFWPAMPEWALWVLLSAVGIVVLVGMALNDAIAAGAGIRTLPVWKTYGAGVGFMVRSLIAYPAPIALTAAAGGLDGWLGLTDPVRANSPMSLLMNALGLFTAAAGYRYAFRPLRPNGRDFRLGPLGLQIGETEARTLMANLGYGLMVLAPLLIIVLVGIGVMAALPNLVSNPTAGQALAGGTIGVIALVLMLLFLLRSWLVIPHIVFRKALAFSEPWKATRGAVFSTFALMVLWAVTFMAVAMAAYVAVGLMDGWIENSERWAMAAGEGLAAALATPLFVGIQTHAYKRLMDLKPPAADASRPPLVE